ncbi:unnamed protein product [Menidia menidia]|uniref:(Atlantic silverside) hypothetical protein n=1 Tax=Menidia menidia TaxID=238744 RepID=A0A8S4B4M8_9TELE|nr:unnamed protein product [Menidia menidia]
MSSCHFIQAQDVLQEYFQKGKVHAALKKANLEDEIIEVLKHYKEEMEKLYPILRLLKTATSEFALHRELMKVIDDFLDQQKQNLAAYREQRESELEEIWNFVEVADAHSDEL